MQLKTKILVIGLFLLLMLSISASLKEEKLSKTELGKQLFFDKTLSLDSSISCASCHLPEFAFSDTSAFSIGVNGRKGLRNTPSIMNLEGRDLLFFDGRAKNIEHQVHFPIEDQNEMNLAYKEVIKRLNSNPQYVFWFKNIYNTEANLENVANAIAAYELTLETFNTPFDEFMKGNEKVYSASEKRGRELFISDKTKCFDCHFGPDFTGDEFKNVGLYDGVLYQDKGRFEITKDSNDLGKFKVPGLRNIGVTAPYMHNGMFKTLEEVIEYYDNPFKFVKEPINMDSTLLKPLNLSKQEKKDLLNFLLTLTDKQFKNRTFNQPN